MCSAGKVVVNLPAATATSVILTGIVYFCVRRVEGVRFLNMQAHVTSKKKERFNFVDDFKAVLGKLGSLVYIDDVEPITQKFFHQAFTTPSEHVSCILREDILGKNLHRLDPSTIDPVKSKRIAVIEKVFGLKHEYANVIAFIKKNKIIIRDEVEFTNFYNKVSESSENLEPVIVFLKNLNAEVFLPVFHKSRLVGSIIIDRDARPEKFYTDVERDEMLIYTDYLGRVIHVLGSMNFDTILNENRTLRNNLYKQNKLFSLFKKSIHAFATHPRMSAVGVLVYKNKRFGYCNKSSQDLLEVDLNKDKGLDFTQKISGLAQECAQFFTPKHALLKKDNDDIIMAQATPNLEKNNTIVTVSRPTISDIIKDELPHLREKSKWTTLITLKTTEEGAAINRLLPVDTPTLLHIKIAFFELVLSQKTIFLEMVTDEDILAFAHAAHKINNRKEVHEITINRGTNQEQLGANLFGVNPVVDPIHTTSLLEKLTKKGTLFLHNVHLLNIELQEKLLEFIRRGTYSPLRSDEVRDADVIIICSTTHHLLDFVGQGLFLKDLYLELRKRTTWLPSLTTLPEDEFLALAEGIRSQLVHTKLYQNLLAFTDKDKQKLIDSCCVSIHELKTKIQGIILKKTRRQSLKEEMVIDPAATVSDLELASIARLGKGALKDAKVLTLVWVLPTLRST